jgi:hypothetical protein
MKLKRNEIENIPFGIHLMNDLVSRSFLWSVQIYDDSLYF